MIMKLLKICTISFFASTFLMADDTPLEEVMSEANTPYKQIRRGKTATWDEKLEWANGMAASFEKSIQFLPKGLEDPKLTAQYKKMIHESLSQMYAMQIAAIEKDDEAYAEAFQKVKDLKSDGHDLFIED